MSAVTETALVVMSMLCDKPSGVSVPVKSVWVTGHDLYRESGPRDGSFVDLAPSLSQGW